MAAFVTRASTAAPHRSGIRRGTAGVLGLLVLGLALGGCNEAAVAPIADGGAAAGGLTPEQAAAVVAKVGDRSITLGDFAQTLERMNQYDRLRYQTKDQRRKLLQEMIDNELMAQEAARQGLDKDEKVEQAIRQILRDAMLAEARRGLPTPPAIPMAEVREYYENNQAQFSEPERRRVSAIVLTDADKAAGVLEQAQAATTGAAWGELYFEHSTTAPKKRNPTAPADLAGDLGIVGPPGDRQGLNKKVPEAVQRAVFSLEKVGDVHGELVKAEGKLYIVRLSGRTAGHTRSLSEADRSIRVRLLQQKIQEAERKMLEDLRKRFTVTVDDAALAAVELPEVLEKVDPHWEKKGDRDAPAAPAKTAEPAAPPAPNDAGAP